MMRHGMDEYLRIDECEDGCVYLIAARNGYFGIYNADKKTFTISRYKFGSTFLDDENHWDTGAPYGTVKPIKKVDDPQEFKDDKEKLEFLTNLEREGIPCSECGAQVYSCRPDALCNECWKDRYVRGKRDKGPKGIDE